MSDLLRTGCQLLLVAAVAGFLLAVTESATEGIIAEHRRLKEETSRLRVLPGARRFVRVDLPGEPPPEGPGTRSITLGFGDRGEFRGTVLRLGPMGYSGPIDLMIGLTPEGRVSGVSIQSMRETPGLGSRLSGGFLERFLSLAREAGTSLRISLKRDGGDIDGLTGATVSSRAFCRGVREGVAFVEKNRETIQALVARESPAEHTPRTSHGPATPPATTPGNLPSSGAGP